MTKARKSMRNLRAAHKQGAARGAVAQTKSETAHLKHERLPNHTELKDGKRGHVTYR
jgi:hypothetical protein